MPKNKGFVCIAIGTVLLLSALSLFLYNRYEDKKAAQEAESLLAEMQSILNEPTSAPSDNPSESLLTTEPTAPTDATLKEVKIDGYNYIGYLTIPSLDLELPVMSEWDYTRLKIAPCRQFGSSKSDNLVIAAHNYSSHFGYLKYLEEGDEIYFKDMEGNSNSYAVQVIATMAPEQVTEVQNSGYDLVLYTCTPGGATRVTVFCNRTN